MAWYVRQSDRRQAIRLRENEYLRVNREKQVKAKACSAKECYKEGRRVEAGQSGQGTGW